MPRLESFLLSLCLLLAHVAFAAPGDVLHEQHLRGVLARDTMQPCRNTQAGLSYVTDDKGMVCPRSGLNLQTGCCSKGTLHSCDTCTLNDRCCSSYEHCVSCCLKPAHTADAAAKSTYRAPARKESGHWADAFEYCQGICRTHSGSTMHENAYISARHHCFSQLRKPMVSSPVPSGALDGVRVVLGGQGAGCDAACGGAGATCSEPHLRWLNSCDRLREHVGCEAGCVTEVEAAVHLPAYVTEDAAKQDRPAMCLLMSGDASRNFSCAGRAQNTRRLCACTASAAAVQAAVAGVAGA